MGVDLSLETRRAVITGPQRGVFIMSIVILWRKEDYEVFPHSGVRGGPEQRKRKQ